MEELHNSKKFYKFCDFMANTIFDLIQNSNQVPDYFKENLEQVEYFDMFIDDEFNSLPYDDSAFALDDNCLNYPEIAIDFLFNNQSDDFFDSVEQDNVMPIIQKIITNNFKDKLIPFKNPNFDYDTVGYTYSPCVLSFDSPNKIKIINDQRDLFGFPHVKN